MRSRAPVGSARASGARKTNRSGKGEKRWEGPGSRARHSGAGRAAANKTVKLGMILPSSDQFRWKNADGRFFLEEAKKLGVDSEMQSSNMSEATQASQVENMLTLGIDALVLTPVNANAAASLVRKAKSAGVPVVNYNFLINKAECDAFVGRDAIEIGERIAVGRTVAGEHGRRQRDDLG